ncbi:MAG: M23 family metallopeptidase, partial [Patescibacteria group bacterium]
MSLISSKLFWFVMSIILAIGLTSWYLWQASNQVPILPSDQPAAEGAPADNNPTSPAEISHVVIRADGITGADGAFRFLAEIPKNWQAESVSESQSLMFYDPNEPGSNNLEKAQIFVRYFSANKFLTLATVDILEKEEQTLNGRPAVRYRIKKKATVANFASQPSWRNEAHVVTDIRVEDSNPSVFYVIAKRPGLSDEVYQRFLTSLQVVAPSPTALFEPIADFKSRITKKRFGTFVTPTSSPVSPERFSGWHTGVDVEYGDSGGDVAVLAIADGVIMINKIAAGYGGVLAISHLIKREPVVAIYGHLDPKSLPASAVKTVKGGSRIAILGDGQTAETDNERKHLHFALVKGERA